MTEYEKIIITAVNEDKANYVIFGRIFTALKIDYFSTTDRILIMKDINYIRERVSKGLSIPSGFMRWKTD